MLRQKRTVWENIKKSSLEKYRDALRYAKKEHINIKRLLKKEKRVFSRKISLGICFIEKKIEITKGKCKKYERRLERKLEKKTKRKVKEFIVFIKRYLKDIKRENQKQFLKYKRKIKREFLRKGKLIYESLIDFFKGAPSFLRSQSVLPQEILAFIFNNINLGLITPIEFLISLEKDLQKVILKRRKKLEIKIDDFGLIFKKQYTKVTRVLEKEKKVLLKKVYSRIHFIKKEVRSVLREYERGYRREYKRYLCRYKKYVREQKGHITKLLNIKKRAFSQRLSLGICFIKRKTRAIQGRYKRYGKRLLKKSERVFFQKKSQGVRFIKKKIRSVQCEIRRYERRLEKERKKIEGRLEESIVLIERYLRDIKKESRKKILKYRRKIKRKILKETKLIHELLISLFNETSSLLRIQSAQTKETLVFVSDNISLKLSKLVKLLNTFKKNLEKIIFEELNEIKPKINNFSLGFKNLLSEIIEDEIRLFEECLDLLGDKLLKFFDFISWYQKELKASIACEIQEIHQKFQQIFNHVGDRILIKRVISLFLIVALISSFVAQIWYFSVNPQEARAANYLGNSSFTGGTTDWTLTITVYDSTRYQDTAGSVRTETAVGRNKTAAGFAEQTISTNIESGSGVELSLYWSKQCVAIDCALNTVRADITKPSDPVTWITIWSDASIPAFGEPTAWTALSNYNVSSNFDETGQYKFRLYADLKNVKDEFAQSLAWFDAVIFDVTPPAATTIIANGTDPGNSTIAPGAPIRDLDSFTFQTNVNTDSITAATTTLSAGSSGGISEIRITSDDGATLYFSAVSNPASDTIGFSGGTPIPVSTTPTQFKIRITPKTHANMPVPPGSDYTVTGTITAWTSTNEQAGTDTGSATITIDNQSPANVTDAGGSAGDTQVSLSWTNPVDADLDSIVVLRATSTVTDTPVEGATYTVGNTIGTSIVACIATSTETSCTDTGLTNGTAYHYKIFTKDTNGNYSADGVVPTGSPFTPQTTLTIGVTSGPKVGNLDSGATNQYINDTGCNTSSTCAAFTLSISFGSETITSIKITETGTVAADTYLSNLALFYDTDDNFSNGTTGQYGTTVANFAADQTANVSGSLVVSSDTTYYFYVRFDVVNGANYPTGGQTVNFQIAVDADVGTTGTPNKTGAPATLAGITSIRPDVTSIAYPQSPDGGRNGDTFTISGVGFATSCADVSVQIQTTDLTCNSAATTSLSVTIPVAQTTTFGGTGSNGLLVTVGGTADDARQDFFIYPKIDSITVPTGFASSTAREFQTGDTDGIITLNGSRFGTNGTVTVLGQSAITTSYADTAVELQIPTSIPDNVYTGDIVLTRTNPSDNKTVTSTGFRILPRIISLIPNNGLEGDAVTISGNHFCQTGTCPPSGQRNTSTSTITFNGVNVPDSDVTAWSDASIEVEVPTGATTGLVIIKSNNFTSNGVTFSVGVPDATSFINNTEGGLLDGGRPGQSITVTGTYFASACFAPSTEVKIGTYSVPCSDVSNWTATSITFTIPTSTTAYGGSGSDGLIIRANDQDDLTPLTFFVYPKVTNIVTPLISGAAREGETITLTGLRFGTTGTVTILGENATISSWQDTSVSVAVPSSIADNNYTGTVILMRSSPSGNKSHTATSSFRILPRIASLNPNSGDIGDPVQILGNHFCQTGTCPAGSKSTSTDNVKFYNAIQVSDANVTAWSDTQIDVKVPSGAETGNVVIRSNDYDSNGVSFTVSEAEEPPPAAPPPSGGIYIYIGAPIVATPKAISQETIRWYFIDTATGETGFKLYIKQNGYYKEIVSSSTPDLEFLNETGLFPNTRYSKRYVRAFRDSWYSNLSGEFSAVYTLIEEPTVLKLKQRTGNSITVELVDTLSNLTSGNSGLFFENVTSGRNSGWIQVDFWTSDNLKPGTAYNFRVKARNGDGIETSFSPIYSLSSLEEEIIPVPEEEVPPVVPPPPPEEEIIPPEVPPEEVVLPPSPLQRVREITEDTLDLIKDVILKTIETVQDIESFIKETFTQTTQDISDTAKDVVLKVIKTIVSTYDRVALMVKRILFPEKEVPQLVVPEYIPPQPTLPPKDILFDTLIAKSNFGNISLQLGPEGRFNLLAGANFKAFIRPSKPVSSIIGKILFETTADVPFINLISFLGDVVHAGQEVQAKILLVQEYVFQDLDKDGIYTASISIPPVPGNYILKTSLSYIDGELKEIENQTLVDPRGYVYRLDPDGLKARIINAVVTIYYFNPYTEQYESWPASAYDQKNPQITDDTGEYAFFVPEGKYYLTVSAKNYSFYQSEEFFISEGVFIHKNIELKHEGGFWNMIKRGFNR
ncbi:MAG: IPT/TIG domain-containing protein [Candidatus Nealsonbacteria bacterium]